MSACNTRGDRETARNCVVVGLPESTVRALKVRQSRIPWEIGQVPVKVVGAEPPDKGGKETGCKAVTISGISFSQINLQLSKISSAFLAKSMASLHTGICLIQEPWLRGRIIKRLFRYPSRCKPRACILVKGCDAISMPSWCNQDLAIIKVELPEENGAMSQVVVVSAYFPYDSRHPSPPARVAELIAYCHKKGLPLLLGCDAISHNTVWRNTDTNARSEALLQYQAPMYLMILNRGNDPTLTNAVWKKVIDLTFCSREVVQYL